MPTPSLELLGGKTEFNTINPVVKAIEPDHRKYVHKTESNFNSMVFNNTVDVAERKKVETRKVEVSAVALILESGNEKQPIFDQLNNRKDIAELILCADTIIIRSPLIVPSTTVKIYARQLVFEDRGDEISCINTSPLAVEINSKADEAQTGAKAGNIHLNLASLQLNDKSKTKQRFVGVGAKGQNARYGIKGADGNHITPWNGTAVTATWWGGKETLAWGTVNLNFNPATTIMIPGEQPYIINSDIDGYTPVYAEIWSYYPPAGIVGNKWMNDTNIGRREWPGNGKPPVLYPGRPGHGGTGSDIYSTLPSSQIPAGNYNLSAGVAGEKADNVSASDPGTPVKSCWVRAELQNWVAPPFKKKFGDGNLNKKIGYKALEKHIAKPGPAVKAPGLNPKISKGTKGKVIAIKDESWVHPNTVMAVIAFMQDALLAEQRDHLLGFANCYLKAMAELPSKFKSLPDWDILFGQLKGLQQRSNSILDFFGRPAGWAPMLSFESNLKLYRKEIDRAIPALFLAYWIKEHQKETKKAKGTLKRALNNIDVESKAALKRYEVATEKMGPLKTKNANIQKDIKSLQADLEALEKKLRDEVAIDVRTEQFFRTAGQVLGTVMQIIPAGQPALGAVGKGVSILSQLDPDKPMDTVKDLGSVFAEFAAAELEPKAKKLYAKMTETESEKPKSNEDKEYDKEKQKRKIKEKLDKEFKAQAADKEKLRELMTQFSAPQDEIDARLQKIVAEHKGYKAFVARLTKLGSLKSVFAAELYDVLNTMDEAYQTIINNHMAALELHAQLDVTLDALNMQALQYASNIGARAQYNLLKYQYYMVKSYCYMALQPMVLDLDASYMFEEFRKYISSSKDGSLSADQIKSLKTVFEGKLKEVVDKVINDAQTSYGKNRKKSLVSLNEEHLQQLNQPAGEVTINLREMGYLKRNYENHRIINIKTNEVDLSEKTSSSAVNVNLDYRHSGVSRLRRGGQLYLFRHGGTSILDMAGQISQEGTQNYRENQAGWGTTISWGSKEPDIKNWQTDPAEESLIAHLIDGKSNNNNAAAAIQRFRPATWADITIYRSSEPDNYPGHVKYLEIEIESVFHPVSKDLATLEIRVSDSLTPFIECDVIDISGNSGGRGHFLRTYGKGQKVKLTAPKNYANYRFTGWTELLPESNKTTMFRLNDSESIELEGEEKELSDKVSITLDVDYHQQIVAVYKEMKS